jgi:DNA-binding MarR family transcriptional regulator
MSEGKPVYSPVPVRAFGDQRFAGAHFRALGAVASFDRLNGNGRGCFAAYARMADLCGLAVETLKRSLADLLEWGYVRIEINPLDARRRVLFIVYSDEDGAALQGSGRSFTKAGRLKLAPPPARPEREIGDELVTEKAEIGDLRKSQAVEIVERSATNISSLRNYNIYGEAGGESEGGARRAAGSERPRDAGLVRERRLWKVADNLISPADQAAILGRVGAVVRPSPALLATAASLRARGGP